MHARIIATLLSIALAACTGGPVDTSDKPGQARESRASGPAGLEQRLNVVVDPEDFREPGFHTLLVTSNVINASSSPVSVTSRICLFFGSDLEISAEADRFEPLVSCGAVQQRSELQPGESVGPMEVRYRIRSGPGVYTVGVRHSLDPEFRAQASFAIP